LFPNTAKTALLEGLLMFNSRHFSAFLYRRLARWITCEVQLLGEHRLSLDSKFQVNSLQDVFCHPFYWQLYSWLPAAPELVVDLGAHCGHFSMLADVCFRTQFPGSEPHYVLIEPNPKLIRVIEANLGRSGLCRRHQLLRGLVGAKRDGKDRLWVCSRNFLSASLNKGLGTYAVSADYLDLETIIQNRQIDLLKMDIEGAEYGFVEVYPELLKSTRFVMLELHERAEYRLESVYEAMHRAGLRLRSTPVEHGAARLAMFQRD
jgi:FkbM family methyltransferase